MLVLKYGRRCIPQAKPGLGDGTFWQSEIEDMAIFSGLDVLRRLTMDDRV